MDTLSGLSPLNDTATRVAVLEYRVAEQAALLKEIDQKLDRLPTGSMRPPSKDSFVINKSTIAAIAMLLGGAAHEFLAAFIKPEKPPAAEIAQGHK